MSQKCSTISCETKREMIVLHSTVPKPPIINIAKKFKVSRSAVSKIIKNCEPILSKPEVNNISFRFAGDFKILNICLGLQNSVATYPCPYCVITLKDLRDLERVLNAEEFGAETMSVLRWRIKI